MNERALAVVYLEQIKKNLRIITKTAEKNSKNKIQFSVPMIKSNAYGHGIVEVAKSLSNEKGVVALGVASIDEAICLRSNQVQAPLWIFSGSSPWTEDRLKLCLKENLIPILFRLEDVKKALTHSNRVRNFKFQIKFNTGMNRLGIDLHETKEVLDLVEGFVLKKKWNPVLGICTHYSESEKLNAKTNFDQTLRFKEVVQMFSKIPLNYIHSANTMASLREDLCGMGETCNLIRPGIGIYGYAGSTGEKLGIKPAMQLKAKCILDRKLKTGDRVGYGGTFAVEQSLEQSILSIGYGDGIHRSLSNKSILLQNKSVKVLGRISMDLMSVGIKINPGKWVTLIGENLKQGEHLSQNSDTINYEMLTSINQRVPRVYTK